ncbi:MULTISPECIES: poly-gamma-glutamate synthase PgsB [unclassified Streptomyces]|uniref:poly-gamma-glutamate synthase PgsB n=1 Tax=unclassified Streptomyces TaxID=2593676 RepID=UPI002256CDA2|nr:MULTISPECIES: poly-gamma-glutamate synthase PgsB [unclassified Streptomyces]MCX4987849.1 poly-gamma-glutamate synthase PgsB [Streptomyces sp. NBC_00568]MCX5007019.1 poly-gamma-glutamate synthase PgsB [Streptomyces sp. NBC_00638]
MLFLFTVLVVCCAILLVAGIVEQRRHFTNLDNIPTRVLVNGIRGKSSITRLCAGALRGGGLTTVAKTTGTAARFIHPDATEEPVYRKFGIANVVEQIGIVRRAAAYNPDALVIECMAVMPALQEINQSKLIRSTIGVLCNVREDHLAEMGPTLDDVARSLSRSMPEGGICVTAEQERFAILQEEADSRDCKLIYADPETVSDEELRGFSWFTFKENVAIALTVAELLGVERETALQGMYDAPPDPGVLSVERYVTEDGKKLRFANVFAANDPESTLMNINQLLDLGAIHRPLNVVINCRPDRVERNGQMGEIIPELDPEKVFVIGHPAKSAIDAMPAEYRSRAVDLGGDRRDPEEFMRRLLGELGADSSLVAIGNIHGQGEHLLEHLAELPADDSADDGADDGADGNAAGDAGRADRPGGTADEPRVPTPVREHVETVQLYAPRIDPYQRYSEAYETRYAPQTHVPAQRTAAQPYPQQGHPQPTPEQQGRPRRGRPQQGQPQPQQGHPQAGHHQQGHPQATLDQRGQPQQGQPQQGRPQAAHPRTDPLGASAPESRSRRARPDYPQQTQQNQLEQPHQPHRSEHPHQQPEHPRRSHQPEQVYRPEQAREPWPDESQGAADTRPQPPGSGEQPGSRGLFEPRVPPTHPDDDPQQWRSPGEPR